MRRSKKHLTPAEARRVTVHQVAVEVGWKFSKAQRWLREHPSMSKPRGFPPTYDSRVIDLIREMQTKPRRAITPDEDWLGVYLGESTWPLRDHSPDLLGGDARTPTSPSD